MMKFNKFGYIYSRIKKKHPDWSHKKTCKLYDICNKNLILWGIQYEVWNRYG